MSDGVVHGHIGLDEDNLGIHHPGGSVGIEGQQGPQFQRVFGRQVVEEHIAVPFIHFVQHIHGIVRPHFGQDAGGIVGVQIFQHIAGHRTVKLGQSFGRFFDGHMFEHAHLLLKAELLQTFGPVRRVGKIGVGQLFATGRKAAGGVRLGPLSGRNGPRDGGRIGDRHCFFAHERRSRGYLTKAKGIPNLCGTFRGSPAGTASRAVPTQ